MNYGVERMYSLAAQLREYGDSDAATAAFLVALEGEGGGLASDLVDGAASAVLFFLVFFVGLRNLHGDFVVSPLFMDHSVEGRAERVGRQRADDGAGLGGLARLQGCSCRGFRRRTFVAPSLLLRLLPSLSLSVSLVRPFTAFAAKQLVQSNAERAPSRLLTTSGAHSNCRRRRLPDDLVSPPDRGANRCWRHRRPVAVAPEDFAGNRFARICSPKKPMDQPFLASIRLRMMGVE